MGGSHGLQVSWSSWRLVIPQKAPTSGGQLDLVRLVGKVRPPWASVFFSTAPIGGGDRRCARKLVSLVQLRCLESKNQFANGS